MNKVFLIVCMVILSYPTFAQNPYQGLGSAYHGINIESQDHYEYRRSSRANTYSYSSYSGPKTYISCSFYNRNNKICFEFKKTGIIKDYRYNTIGQYFVGENMYKQCYKVYIRWEHGGETTGSLDYRSRKDGKPKFTIENPSGYSTYLP